MATLTRIRPVFQVDSAQKADVEERRPLHLDIPTPFPQLVRSAQTHEDVMVKPRPTNNTQDQYQSQKTIVEAPLIDEQAAVTDNSDELASSIINVQKSCLTTLNDLLSTTVTSSTSTWRPIIPDRRHSMPIPRTPHSATTSPRALFASIAAGSSPSSPSAGTTLAPSTSSASHTPLQTLVLNLRAQEHDPCPSEYEDMVECVAPADLSDEPALVHELQERVARLATVSRTPSSSTRTLSAHDAALARALVSLVAKFSRLAALHPALSSHTHGSGKSPTALPRTVSWGSTPAEGLAQLQRQISDLQLVRGAAEEGAEERKNKSAVQAVETALLWTRVDTEFDRILELAAAPHGDERTRDEDDGEFMPPVYEPGTYEYDAFASDAELPVYDAGDYAHGEKEKPRGSLDEAQHLHSRQERDGGMSEKMRMDLEAIALAIDRLHLLAPQLHDQRVELKKSKREQLEKMEQARLAGPSRLEEPSGSGRTGGDKEKQRMRPGKERAREELELEKMVDLIGRASERKMVDQAVVLDGGMEAQLERARRRDQEKREAFVTRLARHSDAGRLHSQEAVLAKNRFKDPDAMLSLPEFIREGVPLEVQLQMQINDSTAMLSLPEFVREPVPEHLQVQPTSPPSVSRRKSFRQLRSRSLSAPPLAWLLNQSPRSSSPSQPETPEGEKEKEPRKLRLSKAKRPKSAAGIVVPPLPVQGTAGLDVHYVAEYHETLQHILVFLNVQGITPGVNLEAEVVPISGTSAGDRSRLLLRCGAATSPLLTLPALVPPGVKEVKVMGPYYEIKLAVTPPSSSASDTPSPTILDATQLLASGPSSFVCAACSLPLIQASKLHEYRDLPSEHWAELVDAWMCHSDQRLHDQVREHSVQGFWPQAGEALVGGGYILFEESAVVQSSIWPAGVDDHKQDDGWRRTRCICGAIIGRCQERPSTSGERGPLVYRLAKYAVRPASTSPSQLPLSAFIAEDMNEFVHAHATYRFVIFDEEEERPRLLIWLFKPNMRLSYAVPTQYLLAKSASVRAGKVLFRVLDSAAAYSDLDGLLKRYPGFPQAEHLYYPRSICQRLAALLVESNKAYPENMRTMTGLDVGWLQRA